MATNLLTTATTTYNYRACKDFFNGIFYRLSILEDDAAYEEYCGRIVASYMADRGLTGEYYEKASKFFIATVRTPEVMCDGVGPSSDSVAAVTRLFAQADAHLGIDSFSAAPAPETEVEAEVITDEEATAMTDRMNPVTDKIVKEAYLTNAVPAAIAALAEVEEPATKDETLGLLLEPFMAIYGDRILAAYNVTSKRHRDFLMADITDSFLQFYSKGDLKNAAKLMDDIFYSTASNLEAMYLHGKDLSEWDEDEDPEEEAATAAVAYYRSLPTEGEEYWEGVARARGAIEAYCGEAMREDHADDPYLQELLDDKVRDLAIAYVDTVQAAEAWPYEADEAYWEAMVEDLATFVEEHSRDQE